MARRSASAGTVAGGLLWVIFFVLSARGAMVDPVAAIAVLLLAVSLPGALRVGVTVSATARALTAGASILVAVGSALYVLFGLGYFLVLAASVPQVAWLEDFRFEFIQLAQGCWGAGMLAAAAAWRRERASRFLRRTLIVLGLVGVVAAVVIEFPPHLFVLGLINFVWLIGLIVVFVWIGVAAWPTFSTNERGDDRDHT
jgi:hypothetical protein